MSKIVFLIFLFFLSRIFFLNDDPIFFDSQEYILRLANPHFISSLYSGHLPFHAGYIFIFWPIFQLAKLVNINPNTAVIIGQVFLAFSTILSFYNFTKFISNSLKALLSTILVCLLPLYWITNSTLMMETTYIAFFMFSLYFLSKYIFAKKSLDVFLLLSCVCFGISFLTHPIVLLWTPFLLYLMFSFRPKMLTRYTIYILLTIIISSIINAYLVSLSMQTNLLNGLYVLYKSKLGEYSRFTFSQDGIIILLRNFLIPFSQNNTLIIILLSALSCIAIYKKSKKIFIICILWIAPAIIANQWWDSLFYGRHALIASFGLAFSVGYILRKNFLLIIAYLLLTSISALYLLKYETPYQKELTAIKLLPKNGILIESHFARPQIDKQYNGTTIFVDEPGWNKSTLNSQINEALAGNRPVFITSQALSEPYGLYSGPYLHSPSLSYRKDYVLKMLLEQFTLKKIKEISKEDSLSLYQAASASPSAYPNIPIQKYDRRRLDFYDPFMQIWFFINKISI